MMETLLIHARLPECLFKLGEPSIFSSFFRIGGRQPPLLSGLFSSNQIPDALIHNFAYRRNRRIRSITPVACVSGSANPRGR